MATRKISKTRKPPVTQRRRAKISDAEAKTIVQSLRRVADRRMTLDELRREGFHLPRPAGKIRARVREFLRKAQKAVLPKAKRKRA